jgi:ELWxxDGT repeat protein
MGSVDRRRVVTISFALAVALAVSSVQADDPYLVKDVNPGPADSYIQNVYAADGFYYFRAYSAAAGWEPWWSDGTTAGTDMRDVRPGTGYSTPAGFQKFASDIFFAASDGVTTGIFALGVTLPIKADFSVWQSEMLTVGSNLFFGGSEIGPSGGDKELWKIDQATLTATRVKDIYPGSLASTPEDLVAVGATLYFTANDGTHGRELWRSNGTGAGTVMVEDIAPDSLWSGPEELTEAGGRLFFSATDGGTVYGGELWVTVGGVPTVIDICPGTCGGGPGMDGMARVGTGVCFRSLGDGTTGAELWCSDGTPSGTAKVKEIGPGSAPGYIALITDFDGDLFYFIADNGTHGSELWRSRGNAASTRMVKNINPTGDSMNNVNSEIVVAGDEIYFTADDGIHGRELWRSDGTEAGTQMVFDINDDGDEGSNPGNLRVVGDRLLFAANDGTAGSELWALDLPLFDDGFESGDLTAWSGGVY